jgi:hypothetical protein
MRIILAALGVTPTFVRRGARDARAALDAFR